MPLTGEEILDNAYAIAKALYAAGKEDSDGGKKITLSEIVTIVTENGINVINDYKD